MRKKGGEVVEGGVCPLPPNHGYATLKTKTVRQAQDRDSDVQDRDQDRNPQDQDSENTASRQWLKDGICASLYLMQT